MTPEHARAHVHSLWLIPEPGAHEILAERVRRLAERHRSPSFEPHITLVGGVRGAEDEVCARAAQIASQMSVLQTRITGVGIGSVWSQSVFLLVQVTDELLRYHRIARRICGLAPSDEYMPHLSLIYGDQSLADKRAIAAENLFESGMSLRMTSIAVMDTGGPVPSWREVARHPLGDRPRSAESG